MYFPALFIRTHAHAFYSSLLPFAEVSSAAGAIPHIGLRGEDFVNLLKIVLWEISKTELRLLIRRARPRRHCAHLYFAAVMNWLNDSHQTMTVL